MSSWYEFCNFLCFSITPSAGGRGMGEVPRAGGALHAPWSAGAPGLMPQAGLRWTEVSGCPSVARPPFFPVTQRCLDWNRDILKKELGLTEQDIIDLPALFKMDKNRQARAFFPNMVRCSGLRTSPKLSVGAGQTWRDPLLRLAEREAQTPGPAELPCGLPPQHSPCREDCSSWLPLGILGEASA